MKDSKWFHIQAPNKQAKLRLFCFPYAGGGTSIFRNWHLSLPAELEVVVLRLPGRENRIAEAAYTGLDSLIVDLHKEIEAYMDLPYMFFGHSNGALVSFMLAHAIQERGVNLPESLVLSAKCAPHVPSDLPKIAHLSQNAFIEELRDMKGTPKAVLDNDELMALLEPMLRADFSLGETYHYEGQRIKDIPVTLFMGLQDKTKTEKVLAWQDIIDSPIQSVEFSGGHFFIDEQRDEVLTVMNDLIVDQLRCLNTSKNSFVA